MNNKIAFWAAVVIVVLVLVAVGLVWVSQRPVEAPTKTAEEALENAIVQEMGVFDANTQAESGDVVNLGIDEGEEYEVVSEESGASFEIEEVLNGEEFIVVGVTNQVAGSVTANQDLSEVEFGVFLINARTLKTDSPNRDRAIANSILKTSVEANEFITFRPTVATAESVAGDLTISGVTQQVTFNGSLERDDEDRLIGSYQAVVDYNDFDLTIPSVPFVASVEDEVLLQVNFVAEVN